MLASTLATVLVALSTHAAAAPVAVTATLRYDMQCGYPGATPVVLTLPGEVPARIPRGDVLVDGKPARAVAVRGRTITVAMTPPPQIMCDVIGPGTLKVVVARAAGVQNPAAGRYRIAVSKREASGSVAVSIR